jgi:ankyrin repeat protein
MAKITFSAKEFLADIKSGMTDSALMEKYGLSEQGLRSVFKRLVDEGVLKQLEGAHRGTVVEKETSDSVEGPQSTTVPEEPTPEPEKKPALALIRAQASRFKEFLRTRKQYIAVASIGILIIVVVLLQPNRLDNTVTESLMNASAGGHVGVLEELLDKGADINAKGRYGITALMLSSERGHVGVVQLLLAKGADVSAKDDLGVTALMHASDKGHVDAAELLLDKGADVNAKDKDGGTALMQASFAGHVDVVNLLLANGADINAKDKDGKTALMAASSKWHQELVNLLKAYGAK